jgi:orotate phosphoribosyltransferase
VTFPNPDREELKQLLLQLSIRRGTFRLASGLTSDVYVDGKMTTFDPRGMVLVGRVFLQTIDQMNWRPEAVGGLVVGAVPIAQAITREAVEEQRLVRSFFVRKEPKKTGEQKFIEGIQVRPGMNVVVIDDVCTKGGSTADAVTRARDAGMNVLGAVCLVDREAGAAQTLRQLDCPFESVFRLKDIIGPADIHHFAPSETSSVV